MFERVIGSIGAQISREDYFGDGNLDLTHDRGEVDG